MSVSSILGQTFGSSQVTAGTASLVDGAYTYTENTAFGTATLLVGSLIQAADGTITIGISYSANGSPARVVTATVLGNTTSALLVSATINGASQTLYLTNSPSGQPGVGGSVAGIPVEASAPGYTVPCYCSGTLIRTARGDVPVEEIAVGDLLATVSGGMQPVRWVGTRSYAGRFFSANPGIWPVRFRAGSLGRDKAGAAVPSRDLLVSPQHAMLLDGVLVPAELLVNGRTVVRDNSAGAVSYFHVELPGHHAIWAENATSESFADDGSRGMFGNAASFAALYPDAVAAPAEFCAPRVTEGPQFEAIRRRLGDGLDETPVKTGPDALAA